MTGQGSGRTLALAFVAPPYRDRAALIAAHWLRTRMSVDAHVDVLTAAVDRFRHRDAGSADLLPRIQRRLEVAVEQAPHVWGSHREFLEKGLECLAGAPATEPYAVLLSAVPSGHSVLLGAALRDELEQARWIVLAAEPHFTAYDRPRVLLPEDCPVRELMRGLLESREAQVPESADASVWLERLAVAVADEVAVLTEAHREALVSAHPGSVRARVSVQSLPAPPESLYAGEVPAALCTGPAVLDVGWFDDDPTQPELTVVIEALRALPRHVRERIRLHVVAERPQRYDRLVTPELAECVVPVCVTDVRDRLAALRAVDVVLALEAGGPGAGRGPRWSWVEALGSGTPVLGIGPRDGSLAQMVPSVLPSGHRTALMQRLAQLVSAHARASVADLVGAGTTV